jgi:ribosomal protein S18 acetylase RimI-like enzyme
MPSMTDLTLRRATAADEQVLAALAARLSAFELPAWRAAQKIADADSRAMIAAAASGDPDDEVLIAERGGEVVGCLHVLAVTDFFGLRHGHVSVIATMEAAEGSGVARRLMEHAEQWTAERGLPLLTLNMFAGNARARRFYEIAGFEVEMVKYAKEIKSQAPNPKLQRDPNFQRPI